MHEKVFKMMELYIETLTGAAFELRVSPYETVQDVKARIQNLEGIPVSQQHLIWQSSELEDDYSLQDYSIHDGATLKLVLTMRGGPINTRRIPVDDPTLRDMAEYYLSEANHEDIMEKLPQGNRPMTVIVYHNGDQLNFYRVVDPDAASPLSESISGASMYNLYDDEEEEEDDEGTTVKSEENDKTREKMKLLKVKMDSLSLNKKPKKKVPRPPSGSRPCSKTRAHFPTSSGKRSAHSHLNRKSCLPPVGSYVSQNSLKSGIEESKTFTKETNSSTTAVVKATAESSSSDESVGENKHCVENKEQLQTTSANYKARSQLVSSLRQNLARAQDAAAGHSTVSDKGTPADLKSSKLPSSDNSNVADRLETLLRRAQQTPVEGASSTSSTKKYEFSHELLLKGDGGGNQTSTNRKKESSLDSKKASLNLRAAGGSPGTLSTRASLERVLEDANCSTSGPGRPSTTSSRSKELSLEAFKESLGAHHRPQPPSKPSSSNVKNRERKHGASSGVILESLDPSEVRAMSGMLSTIVRSASKPRGSSFTLNSGGLKEITRIPTPEGRHMSARLQRLSASRDGRVISPHPRLPPVKQKKKTSKRCFVCTKKTGLATSFQCRCGNNFCATHRYAEAHDCPFDYKTEGRKILEQSNPVVTAPKLPKI